MNENEKEKPKVYDSWSSKNSYTTRTAHAFARLFITGYPRITAYQLKKCRDSLDIMMPLVAHVYKSEFVKMYIHLRNLAGNPVKNKEGFAVVDVMEVEAQQRDRDARASGDRSPQSTDKKKSEDSVHDTPSDY